jgi:hypothetical protein
MLAIALKEWAVVQRSLAEGHQIVLVRKGGLIEERGEFDLRAPWFLLYPTYEHETERIGDVQPCFGQWLTEEEARKPIPNQIRFEMAAHVTDVLRVDDREKLLRLAPQHIWSAQFLNGRYDWEPYKPVFVLLLRVYLLPEPQTLSVRPEYGGCRSWITLSEPISLEGATPVLPDAHYTRRRELTLQLLTNTDAAISGYGDKP